MGDRSFGYSAQVRPLIWVFLVLTPVEILLAWLLWMLYKFKHEIDDETVAQGMSSRSLNKTRSVVDGTLVLEISSSTNVHVRLNEPREIDLGRRGAHQVTKIEFWADNPDEMVRALRK